jgi:hypothetical protein
MASKQRTQTERVWGYLAVKRDQERRPRVYV